MRDLKKFQNLLRGVKRVCLTTHIRPDADGLGSQIALGLGLKTLGFDVFCINEEPIPKRYSYLDNKKIVKSFNQFIKSKQVETMFDLFIVIDTNSAGQVGDKMQSLLECQKKVLFLDHHPCALQHKKKHIINTSVAATGELVAHLLLSLNIKISKDMALAMYTGILTDTSSFRYPTVSPRTHITIAKLLETGINPSWAYSKLYGTKKTQHLILLGKILSNLKINKSGKLAWLSLTAKEMKQHGVRPDDTHSFINHLLILEKIEVAMMFQESGTNIKLSLRSTGAVDVSKLAKLLGGGGHTHSAAAVLQGKLNDLIPKVIRILEKRV